MKIHVVMALLLISIMSMGIKSFTTSSSLIALVAIGVHTVLLQCTRVAGEIFLERNHTSDVSIVTEDGECTGEAC